MIIKTNYKDIFNIDRNLLNDLDPEIINFLDFWKSNKKSIIVNTSGSTGLPKEIRIKRKILITSAKNTLEYFKLKNNSTFHCCLPVKYIGGKMMLVRAFVNKGQIILSKPSKNAVKGINEKVDFSAMTSMQVEDSICELGFSNIKKLIIGGGSIDGKLLEKIDDLKTECYQTFGMTETASHIAIRKLNGNNKNLHYKCLKHVKISTNNNGQMIINSPDLEIKSLTTNDIIKITDYQVFKYVGRIDNTINTGGVKVNAEQIEFELHKTILKDGFFIDKISDDYLGQKMILIALESIDINIILKAIKKVKDKKKRPKAILHTKQFIYTENNKIDRNTTKISSLKSGNLILLSK